MRVTQQLLHSLRWFERTIFPEKADAFRLLANKQSPDVLFLTCSDSRISVEMLTQSNPGELFVARNAGNMVPPYGSPPDATSAALEFGVMGLKVRSIVVCGHSDCGAMKALLHPEKVQGMPSLTGWLEYAKPAWEAVQQQRSASDGLKTEEQLLQRVTEQNIALQVERLAGYPFIAERMNSQENPIELCGVYYNIGNGTLTVYDLAEHRFLPLSQVTATVEVPLDSGNPPEPKRSPWSLPTPADLFASLVTFLVALPLCLGVALAAGVPPALGIVAGIVGGILVGALSGAPLLVSGPAIGLIVVVADIVREYGVLALGPLLVVGGLFQVAAGVLGWGRYFRAISPAVIYGLLAGIGVLIAAGQFHVMLDDQPKGSGLANLLSIPAAVLGGIFPLDGSRHEMAAVAGLTTILVLVLWNRLRPARLQLIPGALAGLLAGVFITKLFGLPIQHVDVPANLWAALSLPPLNTFQELAIPKLFLEALAMAMIASSETLISAAALDRIQQVSRTDYNRELRAQGFGNVVCGFLGALPVTGVIARSAPNVQAGARTRWSTVLHGIWLLLAAVLFGGLLEQIPNSVLAAILVYTGWKLVDPVQFRRLRGYGLMPVVIYAATVLGIVCVNVLTGVLAGVVLTLGQLIVRASTLGIYLDQRIGTTHYDLTLVGAATFVRLPSLAAALDRVPPGANLDIHTRQLTYLDHSCLDLLTTWQEQHRQTGGNLQVDWSELHNLYGQQTGLANQAA